MCGDFFRLLAYIIKIKNGYNSLIMSGRILGIDYGEKRIGIAISDPLKLTAQGLPNIMNGPSCFEKIKDIAEEQGVEEIVIGLPRNLNGSLGPSAEKVKAFSDRLRELIEVPVRFWEEWMSTREAERHLIHSDKSRKKRKNLIDKVSAQLILQGYLDSLGRNDEA